MWIYHDYPSASELTLMDIDKYDPHTNHWKPQNIETYTFLLGRIIFSTIFWLTIWLRRDDTYDVMVIGYHDLRHHTRKRNNINARYVQRIISVCNFQRCACVSATHGNTLLHQLTRISSIPFGLMALSGINEPSLTIACLVRMLSWNATVLSLCDIGGNELSSGI